MTPLLTLLPGTPTWSDEDGAAVRALLVTPSGQHLMRRLLWARPEVAGTEPEARRIRSDERAGFEACIQEILNLATPSS
jgi:hypothetical protein